MITAEIIKDSIAPSRVRITSFVLKYPRCIHQQLLTHRVFSRSSSSSRAAKSKSVIEQIKSNPFVPNRFLKNKKGMKGGEPILEQEYAKELWLKSMDHAIETARKLMELNIHKEYVNRILEPYSHINVVLTSTTFNNFFSLRYDDAAQEEIALLARTMYRKLQNSRPQELEEGEWHLPFTASKEGTFPNLATSVACCARVSYNNHDSTTPTEEDNVRLYNQLIENLHMSPFEHAAMAIRDSKHYSGNFQGWVQYRKLIPGENRKEFQPNDV